jgi:hypothetical protein
MEETELKSTELRIGNSIIRENNLGIRKEVVVTAALLSEMEVRTGCKYFGIPLTEERCHKLEFKNDYLQSYSIRIGEDYTGGQFILTINFFTQKMQISIGGGGEDCDWIFLPIPKYAHQLQNLYFALTEEELTT